MLRAGPGAQEDAFDAMATSLVKTGTATTIESDSISLGGGECPTAPDEGPGGQGARKELTSAASMSFVSGIGVREASATGLLDLRGPRPASTSHPGAAVVVCSYSCHACQIAHGMLEEGLLSPRGRGHNLALESLPLPASAAQVGMFQDTIPPSSAPLPVPCAPCQKQLERTDRASHLPQTVLTTTVDFPGTETQVPDVYSLVMSQLQYKD